MTISVEAELSASAGTITPSHHAQSGYAQRPASGSRASLSSSPEIARTLNTASGADVASSVASNKESLAARNNEQWVVSDDDSTTCSPKQTIESDGNPSMPCNKDRSIHADTEFSLSCDDGQLVQSDDEGSAPCDNEEWSDSEDEVFSSCNNKQPCPYVVGFDMEAFEEEPPEPLGRDYDTTLPEDLNVDQRLQTPHELICYRYQARPGRNLSSEPTRLNITAVIRSGADKGTQVVVVNDSMVAKVYDPLFYDPENCLMDAVYAADGEYSREAAAYTHLQHYPDLADILPTYFGSYTTQRTATTTIEGRSITYEYPVHIILVEYIRGRCMRGARKLVPRLARYAVFKQCMDADVRLRHAGVKHGDFCPRNIILVGTDFETPNVKVKIIDFGRSIIFFHPRCEYKNVAARIKETARKWDLLKRLPSPLYCWWHRMNEFLGWFPNKDGDESVVDAWMWEEYGHNDRYIPCKWDPENPKSDPEPLDEP
jgi:hypothetical protein